MYSHDNRTVITLDAGGTNFVFGAMRANEFIVEPITVSSNAHDLDKCLATMVDGFRQIIDRLDENPSPSRSHSPVRPTIRTASSGAICRISPRSATAWLSGRSSK